jgi:hypothetical protein
MRGARQKGRRWKMRAAIYARVSTANNGQDPRVQTRELGEFCERRGWTLAEYVDVGVSGTKEKRPALDRLMADAHKRKFDVVVVWKFDRFARSVSHLLRALETFHALGIEFVSLTEGVDTSTPAGRMVFTVLGAVAELERSVVLIKVLTDVRSPTLVLLALAVSILLFGLSALVCLKLIARVASIRGKMSAAILSADPNWKQVFDSEVENWQKELKKDGNSMEWLFRLAILAAGIFVVGFLLTRR